MTNRRRTLLVLTSSFPRDPRDETCGYVREFARAVAHEFDVTVLAPREDPMVGWSNDSFRLVRASSPIPAERDPFRGTSDLSVVIRASLRIKAAALLSFLAYAWSAARLARYADVICAHWLAPCGVIAVLIGRLMRKPVVVVEHSGALHFLRRSFLGRSILRWIVKNCSRVITVSEDLRSKLLAVVERQEGKEQRSGVSGFNEKTEKAGLVHRRDAENAETAQSSLRHLGATCASAANRLSKGIFPLGSSNRIVVLPMGVHANPNASARTLRTRLNRPGRPENVESGATPPATFLYLGRLAPIKGVDVLMRAVSTLPATRLVVAGDGEIKDDLERTARRLGIEACFTGIVGAEQRARLLASCDAVVIPSLILSGGRSEGLPVVCLEAMAAAKPVIASRTGGLAEVIVDGQNGLLAEPGDHVDLAAKIKLILEDDTLRRALSINAAEMAGRFDWSRLGPRFASLFTDALVEHQKGWIIRGGKGDATIRDRSIQSTGAAN